MSIKYYQLTKGEELPDEFCVVRDIGGEPSEYTFYVPEGEVVKLRKQVAEACTQLGGAWVRCTELRELVEDMLSCIGIRAAFNRPPTTEMYEEFAQQARELGVEVDR